MPRYLVLSFSFILLILFFLNLGNFLDISQEPRKTELIVCLGGGEKNLRIEKSISIYQNGNLLLITGGTEFTIKNPMKDDRISYLAKYPNIKFEYNPSLKNTADELIFIKEIIVTIVHKIAKDFEMLQGWCLNSKETLCHQQVTDTMLNLIHGTGTFEKFIVHS